MILKRGAGANNLQTIIFALAAIAVAGTLAVTLFFTLHVGRRR